MRAATAAIALASVLAAAVAAEASIEQYLGRPVVDVRVDVSGRPLAEPAVMSLIETRVGEPLTMARVRTTIDHLVGLGRFEDVRVYATAADPGVVLRWSLTPVRVITKISVTGAAAFGAGAVRAEIADRFGAQPSVGRVGDMIRALQGYYEDRGYRHAAIAPRLVDLDQPGRVELELIVTAGTRTLISESAIAGTPRESPAALVRRLGIERGRPYDGPELAARLTRYEDELRALGYYEASARESHTFGEDDRTVSVSVTVSTGPRVRVAFAGDPVADAERQALDRIREARSVDLDLLEDASRTLELGLRRQGYRSAEAPSSRRQTGSELLVTFTVTRGPLHRVGAVDVAGSSGMPRADLGPLLQALKPGDAFADERVAAVASAMTELYRVTGFAAVSVTPLVQVLPPETRDGVSFRPVDVRFDLVEGPQTVVASVAVQGASAIAETEVRAALGLTPGRPFYRPQLAADRETVERLYRGRGYQDATAVPRLTFGDDERQVMVTWVLREGPQVTVDHVLVSGNTRTSTDLIRREITLQRGSPLSNDAIVESQRRLAALGLFRRVRITELPRSGEDARDVLVEVDEADTTSVAVGGGLEVGGIYRQAAGGGPAQERLDFAPRAFADVSRRNLWGKNRSVTLFGRVALRRRDPAAASDASSADTGGYGFNDYRGFFSFREPRAFGTTGDAQLTAFVEQGVRSSFNFHRKGVSSDYARRFGAFTVTGRYTFDTTRLFDEQILPEDQLLIDRLFPQVRLSKFFGALLRDSRDDVLDPQRGAVLGIDGTLSARALGSEVGFVKTFLQGFLYRRVPGRRVVLAMGARVGAATGFEQAVPAFARTRSPGEIRRGLAEAAVGIGGGPSAGDTVVKDLPASERFFAGGDTTVRGFALDRLGTASTLDPQGFPQGGNGLAVFNLEARAPYWKNLQFVWFADAGNVFKQASDIRLTDLRASSGIGVRYRSPIGPIRVDWGWKLSTRLELSGGRERSNIFHISLGQAF
jgi:outer membrane protein assembly factor BamA